MVARFQFFNFLAFASSTFVNHFDLFMKRGIILMNLGSPDSTEVKDVRRYLSEFLMDERVIDYPYLPRLLLVKGIIVPFRAPKSAEAYKSIWSKDGWPADHERARGRVARDADHRLLQPLGRRLRTPRHGRRRPRLPGQAAAAGRAGPRDLQRPGAGRAPAFAHVGRHGGSRPAAP